MTSFLHLQLQFLHRMTMKCHVPVHQERLQCAERGSKVHTSMLFTADEALADGRIMCSKLLNALLPHLPATLYALKWKAHDISKEICGY
jgi:hypothetical protein